MLCLPPPPWYTITPPSLMGSDRWMPLASESHCLPCPLVPKPLLPLYFACSLSRTLHCTPFGVAFCSLNPSERLVRLVQGMRVNLALGLVPGHWSHSGDGVELYNCMQLVLKIWFKSSVQWLKHQFETWVLCFPWETAPTCTRLGS